MSKRFLGTVIVACLITTVLHHGSANAAVRGVLPLRLHAIGQEKETASQAEDASVQETASQEKKEAVATVRTKPRRLPTYYARVVTQLQRENIYNIQDRYEAEIRQIQAQMEAKIKERDQAIEDLLEPDQLAQVKRFAADAAKRKRGQSPPKDENR